VWLENGSAALYEEFDVMDPVVDGRRIIDRRDGITYWGPA